MVLVTLLLLVILPLIGLAIDGGILYFLKARLSQAVDAASLAGARSLNRGADIGSQTQNATDTATRYFKANFKDNFWGCTVPAPVVQVAEDTGSKARSVTVTATVTAPLYFLRIIGQTTAMVGASAQARRRDVNIMMVLDRSYSMGSANGVAWCATCGAIKPMITAANSFVNQFAPGRDNVGVVIFGGSYYLENPTTSFLPTVVNDINSIQSAGNTGTAQALWVGYQALAGLAQPGALNVILFFTDGLPNGVTTNFNHALETSGLYTDLRIKPAGCGSAASMLGWISQTSGFVNSPGVTHGIFNIVAPKVADPDTVAIANDSGCKFATNANNMYQDISRMPDQDYYGNLINPPNPYLSTLYPQATGPVTLTAVNNATQVARASFNAADQAVARMRAGEINGIAPQIYVISLVTSAAEVPDPGFMIRVANVPQASVNGITYNNAIYDSTKPVGMYIDAQHQDELQTAFQRIASEILRLSQ